MSRFRHEATEAVRRAERNAGLLASIVESSDDAIMSKNLKGIIISWNKGAERLFGHTAAEAMGKSITILIPPERIEEEPRISAGSGAASASTITKRFASPKTGRASTSR